VALVGFQAVLAFFTLILVCARGKLSFPGPALVRQKAKLRMVRGQERVNHNQRSAYHFFGTVVDIFPVVSPTIGLVSILIGVFFEPLNSPGNTIILADPL